MRKYIVFVTLVLVLLPLGASALEEPDILRANWGVLVESLTNPALSSQVSSPSINFNFGAGVSMPLSPDSPWSFGPSADLYWYYGEFNGGQPVATDEAFSSTFVLGLLLNAPVVYSIPLDSKFTFSAGAGLCLDLRFAFQSGDLDASAAKSSNAYFWGMGRFITPSTTLRIEYKLTERVGFGFSARVLWPVYNLWTGEGYGFFDQGKYLLSLVVRYKLKAPVEATAAAAVPVPAAAVPPAEAPAAAAPPAPAPAAAPAPASP
jgi:hypothetical protein